MPRSLAPILAPILALACTAALAAASARPSSPVPDFAGSASQRKVFFDQLLEKTLAREAFGRDPAERERFREEAEALRKVFLDAKNETALYYAILRFSNLRRSSTASFEVSEEGLRPRLVYARTIPLTVACDFTQETPRMVLGWVADDVEQRATELAPGGIDVAPGDQILQVEGRSVADYVDTVAPYLRWSTKEQLWEAAAAGLGRRSSALGPEVLAKNDVEFLLAKPSGGRKYRARFTWERPEAQAELPTPGFRRIWTGDNGIASVPASGTQGLVVLRWYDFDPDTLDQDLEGLTRILRDLRLYESDVVLDLTRASAEGSGSWKLLQILTGRSFRVPTCDLRLSDAVALLTEQLRDRAETRLLRWLEDVAIPAFAAGEEWIGPVPFRLDALPADADGTVAPAESHFTGHLVVLLGPNVAGEAERLACTIVDNDLGLGAGLPTAGRAPAWIHTESLALPKSERALVEFEWELGRTLRPNEHQGPLTGHPVVPGRIVPLPADRSTSWDSVLLLAAIEHFAEEAAEKAGSGGSPDRP